MPTAAVSVPIRTPDLVVLGAGPAGLGAGLHAARNGARVVIIDERATVGGLCVTRRFGALRYDLGGHIPFVEDARRQRWLADLLGNDLLWVPRPVSSWRDGVARRGRYLDQRPRDVALGALPAAVLTPGPRESGRDVLDAMFGAAFVDAEMRPYLEKIDGVDLARIPGVRPLRLMREQAAPEGFWFPRWGIGQLMEAMSDAITTHGGQVLTGVAVTAIHAPDGEVQAVEIDGGRSRVFTTQLVVGAPAGSIAHRLVPAPSALPPLRMRAVCIVYLEVGRADVTGQAWVQVDDPRVPAARIFEMPNWSRDMCPAGRSLLGMECYCTPSPGDLTWASTDADLGERCAAALVDPLGWLGDPRQARLVEVVRLPAGYPAPDLAQLDAMNAAPRLLEGITGVRLARGSAVVDAIAAGEECAAAALASAR